jgi:preprotein translocase subunit SecF
MIASIIAFIQKWLLVAIISGAALVGVGFYAYNKGVDHQKQIYIEAQLKANEKVVEKNDKLQEVSDKQDEQQVIYKDRIITKYNTITKEVIKYETTPVASEFLDPEFIRLHDAAARANDQDTIAGRASGPDGEAGESGVTAGQAIGVITRNYQSYYECARRLDGLQEFYMNLQKEVND